LSIQIRDFAGVAAGAGLIIPLDPGLTAGGGPLVVRKGSW
jgi:hypothetical protein